MQDQHHLIKMKPIVSLFIATVLMCWVIIIVGKVLIPFITAFTLAYILNPLVDRFARGVLGRKVIALFLSMLILSIFIAIPLYLVPVLIEQFKLIITSMPQIVDVINHEFINHINNQFNTHLYLNVTDIQELMVNNETQISYTLNWFSHIARNGIIFLEICFYILLVPFALFYSIISWHKILFLFAEMIPRSFSLNMQQLFYDIDKMLSSYLRGQLSVMIIMALYYAVTLNIVGLPSATAIGIFTGLLVFIPYLGIFSCLLIALTVALSQPHSMLYVKEMLIVFAAGHILEGAIVTPFLVGGRIGLNPVMIILSLMVMGKVFGVVGVFLALPLSTIAIVLLKHAKQYYQNTGYYKEN